jgi:hypothetical protein
MKQFFTHVEMFGDNTLYIEMEQGIVTVVSKSHRNTNAHNITPQDIASFCRFSNQGWKEITEEEALSYHDRPDDWYMKEEWYGGKHFDEEDTYEDEVIDVDDFISGETSLLEMFGFFTESDDEKTRGEWRQKFQTYKESGTWKLNAHTK